MSLYITLIRYYRFCFLLFLCSCIGENLEDCPVNPPEEDYLSVKLVYDYNMSFEDLFHHQVSNFDLYLFNDSGIFIQKITENSYPYSTFPRGYTLKVSKVIAETATKFIAIAGKEDNQKFSTFMHPKISTIDDLCLKLTERSNNKVNTAIAPSWYGSIEKNEVRTTDTSNSLTISLVKNTNTIRVVLQSITDSLTIDKDDFSFCVQAANGSYNAKNIPNSDEIWYYYPYLTENHEEESVVAELNTMRILSDRENRLIIKYLPTDESIIDINLNKYLHALKLAQYSRMPFEEYLDREDEFNVVIFLTSKEVQVPGEQVILYVINISINGWILREQEGEI